MLGTYTGLRFREAKDFQRFLDGHKVPVVVDAVDLGAVPLGKVVVGLGIRAEEEARQEPGVLAGQELVENVEVPLSGCLMDDTRLLQEVVVDVSANRGTLDSRGGGRVNDSR